MPTVSPWKAIKKVDRTVTIDEITVAFSPLELAQLRDIMTRFPEYADVLLGKEDAKLDREQEFGVMVATVIEGTMPRATPAERDEAEEHLGDNGNKLEIFAAFQKIMNATIPGLDPAAKAELGNAQAVRAGTANRTQRRAASSTSTKRTGVKRQK